MNRLIVDLETIGAQLSCLVGADGFCDWGGLGGVSPVWGSILAFVVPVLAAIVFGLWKDLIKAYLKRSVVYLVCVTAACIIAVLFFSVVGAAFALGVLLYALLKRKRIWGHSMRTGFGDISLPKTIAPGMLVVFALGSGGHLTWQNMTRVETIAPDDLVTFVVPTDLRNTDLNDPLYQNRHDILFDIDAAPQKLLAAPLSDVSVRFAPDLDLQGYPSFRKDYSNVVLRELDFHLERDAALKHLRESVRIAIETNVTLQNDHNETRQLALRAYLRLRDTVDNSFSKIHDGEPILVLGSERTLRLSVLVMTVLVADKMMQVLEEPRITESAEKRIWRTLSSALYDEIEAFAGSNTAQSDTELQTLLETTDVCQARDCVLDSANWLKERATPGSPSASKLATAGAALTSAYGQ